MIVCLMFWPHSHCVGKPVHGLVFIRALSINNRLLFVQTFTHSLTRDCWFPPIMRGHWKWVGWETKLLYIIWKNDFMIPCSRQVFLLHLKLLPQIFALNNFFFIISNLTSKQTYVRIYTYVWISHNQLVCTHIFPFFSSSSKRFSFFSPHFLRNITWN